MEEKKKIFFLRTSDTIQIPLKQIKKNIINSHFIILFINSVLLCLLFAFNCYELKKIQISI